MCQTDFLLPAADVTADADDKVDGSDDSDNDEAMEMDGATSGDVPMETEPAGGEKDAAKAAPTKSKAAPKLAAVCSGLPQSREELKTLIQTIHQTVNDSVLPRLNKCLTAKVTHTHTH